MDWAKRIVLTFVAIVFLIAIALLALGQRPGAGRNQTAIEINRPAAQAFSWLIEPDKTKRWISGFTEAAQLTPSPVISTAHPLCLIIRRGDMMRSAKKLLHDTVDQLSEEEAQETLRLFEHIASSEETVSLARQHVSNAKKIVRLVTSETAERPDLKPARFEPFHAIPVAGIPASQLLIADRR